MIGPAASGSVTARPPAGRLPLGSALRGAPQERARLPLVRQADPEQQDAERDAAPAQAEDPQADRRPCQPTERGAVSRPTAGQRPREGHHRNQEQQRPADERRAARRGPHAAPRPPAVRRRRRGRPWAAAPAPDRSRNPQERKAANAAR